MSSGSMQSNVGNRQIYEDGDQRNWKQDNVKPGRFESGQENAHNLLDSKDNRSLGVTLEAAQRAEREEEERDRQRTEALDDPTRPAQDHGNKPSRGAEIDAELQEEEQEYLQRKGKI